MSITYAAFTQVTDAERAYGALLDHGLSSDHISVLASEKHYGTHGTEDERERIEGMGEKGVTTTTAEDAGKAAVPGAAIGLGVGALAAASALLIPGIGFVIGGGALGIALGGAAGATAGGALAGGVYGYLKDQGVEEEHAKAFESAYDQGDILLIVDLGHADDPTLAEVDNIVRKYEGRFVRDAPVAPRSQTF